MKQLLVEEIELRFWKKGNENILAETGLFKVEEGDFCLKIEDYDLFIPINELLDAIANELYDKPEEHCYAVDLIDSFGINQDIIDLVEEKFPGIDVRTRNKIFGITTSILHKRDLRKLGAQEHK